ncbi:hypothetical protein [Dactylosporangium sp. CS-033363]|uniref:hypothetical protein n=1 Tax=Dactylosporangium sp. CS-033363 TaxID=3239935 RepID=UPI003D908DA4
MLGTDQPDWVLGLVAAVERYEYVHAPVDPADTCLQEPLQQVPAEVRAAARGWAQRQMALEGAERAAAAG